MERQLNISLRLIPLLALPLFSLVGCADKVVEVKGKVTYQGKEVCGGGIQLVAKNNQVYGGTIAEDGTYIVSGVPAGEVKIGVSSPDPSNNTAATMRSSRSGAAGLGGAAKKGEAAPAKNSKWFKIPDKYSDPDKSGLTGVAGTAPLDVDLK